MRIKRIYEHNCAECGHPSFRFHEGLHTVRSTYFWVCSKCGVQMKLRFATEGGRVEQTPTGRRCDRTLALLGMDECSSLRFIYEGRVWDGQTDNRDYYEEHTCPSNLLRCEEVFWRGVPDWHGIFHLLLEFRITGPGAIEREEALRRLTERAKEV